ncbi:MAG: LD-carboxypeptidase [Sandaracinaceae bacterium]|nr:LD-carboxypeptidase [Sandaracinaceae bacterium]
MDPDEDEPFAKTTRPFVRPEALYPGARVRLVAPSGVFDRARFEKGAARLAQRYDVVFDEGIFTRTGYLAGSDERRRDELLAAIDDPLCQAIVCARGGYGAMRLLPSIPLARLARAPKLLVGFSDITALHVLWQRARVSSVHASMAAALGELEEPLFERWIRCVEGAPLPAIEGLETIVAGHARGVLVGGNLSMLHALEGTPYSAHAIHRLVFLEDTGEPPYRVDRMLTTLRLSGFFDGARAIVLGAFSKSHPAPYDTTIDEVLRERLADLGIPVVRGLGAGHVPDNLEVPFGVEASLEADERGAVLRLESPVRARD